MPPPSSLERRARRKTQTKLTFDPVIVANSSSPLPATAATKMSPAKVRYQLPTPAQSSQTLGMGKSGGRPSFSQHAPRYNLYDATSDEEEAFPTPLKKKKAIKAPGAFSSLSEKNIKQKKVLLSDSEDDEDDDDELALSTPKAKQHGRAEVSYSDDEDEDNSLPPRKRGGLVLQNEEDSEDKSPVASSTRRRSRPTLVIPDDEDDEEMPILPKPRRPTIAIRHGGIHKSNEIIELSSDDEDDVITPSPAKRRRSKAALQSESEVEPFSSPLKRRKQVIESDDSDIVTSPAKRSYSTNAATNKDEDEDDESDIPRDRPRARKSRPETSMSPVTPSRYTRQARPPPQRKHRTGKQKAAELLRRKRAGEKIDKLTDSSSDGEDEGRRGIYDSDPDLEVLEHFSDEESSPENTRDQVEEAATPTANRDSASGDAQTDEEEDDDDAGFVIDDGVDHRLGVPGMPLQFSRRSLKPLKENFEDCVEWLIRNNLEPRFPGFEDERYGHAFIKVDDEARGYAVSSFLSSQWTAEFTAAVKAWPTLTMRNVEDGEGLTAEGVPKCDACNHRNHPPKYALSFRGQPYRMKTLEDVEQDSDYESGDEDTIPIDEDGNDLVPSGKEWFSGRDCSDKAHQAHKLIHWRHSLNIAVSDFLMIRRNMTEAKIAEREAATADEREAYADKVVEKWTTDGTIHGLYRQFKEMMETARSYEPRRYR